MKFVVRSKHLQFGSTSRTRLYKAPEDYTKPQQTIQSPNTQYKAPETLHKHIDIRQKPLILDKYPKHLTRVATINILTSNIKSPISKTTFIN